MSPGKKVTDLFSQRKNVTRKKGTEKTSLGKWSRGKIHQENNHQELKSPGEKVIRPENLHAQIQWLF